MYMQASLSTENICRLIENIRSEPEAERTLGRVAVPVTRGWPVRAVTAGLPRPLHRWPAWPTPSGAPLVLGLDVRLDGHLLVLGKPVAGAADVGLHRQRWSWDSLKQVVLIQPQASPNIIPPPFPHPPPQVHQVYGSFPLPLSLLFNFHYSRKEEAFHTSLALYAA